MILIEQVKNLREKKKQLERLTVQHVEWDLDPRFFGEPMVPRVLKALSRYVDTKLVDYSSLLGSIPATNVPQGHLFYDDNPNEIPSRDGPTDDHVCSEALTKPIEVLNNTPDDPGPLIDDPELYDTYEKTNWRVRRPPDRHTEEDLINDDGRPGSEALSIFTNENNPPDHHVESDGEDISSEEVPEFRLEGNDPSPETPPPQGIPETSYISELEGDNERDSIIVGGAINSMVGAFPNRDVRHYTAKVVRRNHVSTHNHWRIQEIIQNGVES